MKGIFALLVGIVLVASACADSGRFAVFTKEGFQLEYNGVKFEMEIGDALPFLGYVEQSNGQWVPSENTDYSLLQIDDTTVVVPSAFWTAAGAPDSSKCALTYGQIVRDLRQYSAAAKAKADRPRVLIRRSTNPKEYAYQLRRAKAMENGASQSELNGIDMQWQMEQQTEELRRIRDQQWIFHGGRGWGR